MKPKPLAPRSSYCAHSLRELLNPILKGARYKQAMPTEEALATLAGVLNGVREFHLIEQYVAPSNSKKRKINALIDAAAEELCGLRTQEARLLDLAEQTAALNPETSFYRVAARAKRTQIAELAKVEELITHIRSVPALRDSSSNNIKSFLDHEEQIVTAFGEAMQSTNPTFEAGGSGHDGEGPTVRFLAATLPNLSGELYTSATVGAYLNKRRRQS